MAERLTGHTELIGLMAYPIRHSSSPAMHNEAFAYLGLDYAYLAFEVDNSTLEDAVKGIRALKLVGSNVSMPNKTVVGKYLDKLSPAAELCGAVNTIVNRDGVLEGHITDGIGYMESLRDYDIDVIGKKMTIVGAGGAATAIEIQAALDGVKEISIFNIRDKFYEVGEETVRKINEKTNCKAKMFDLADKDALRAEIADSYLLANATGMGMKPLEGKTWLPDASSYFQRYVLHTRGMPLSCSGFLNEHNGHVLQYILNSDIYLQTSGKFHPAVHSLAEEEHHLSSHPCCGLPHPSINDMAQFQEAHLYMADTGYSSLSLLPMSRACF